MKPPLAEWAVMTINLMLRLAFLYLVLITLPGLAQQGDMQLRSALQLSVDLPKKWSTEVQYQYRADQNLSHFRGSYISGALQYELLKNIVQAEVEYRYRTSYKNEQHRLGAGLTAKYKHGDYSLSWRTLYQKRYPYFNAGVYEPGKEPDAYLRNRIQLKYKWSKRVAIYGSAELFYKIKTKEQYIGRMRYVAGFDWEWKKRHHLNCFYLIQPQYHATNPVTVHAMGVTYAIDMSLFKSKGKKKADYF